MLKGKNITAMEAILGMTQMTVTSFSMGLYSRIIRQHQA